MTSISSALETLLERFAGLILAIGRRHGLTAHEVDELTQAVRIRLWRARESGEMIGATPTSYIYRTAITAALDLIRSRREKLEPLDALATAGEPAATTLGNPVEDIEASEMAHIVGRAVDE